MVRPCSRSARPVSDDEAQPILIAALAEALRRHDHVDDWYDRADAVIRDLARAAKDLDHG